MHQITISLVALCVAVVRVNSACHGCHTPICGENEVPVRGHPRRDKFCRPAYTPREVFKRLRKCVCKPTYVRNSWDECVPRKLCRRCKCRLQKDWHMCSSACPVTYNMTMPFCGRMCVPGCDCPPGWVVDSRNWKREQSNKLILSHDVHTWLRLPSWLGCRSKKLEELRQGCKISSIVSAKFKVRALCFHVRTGSRMHFAAFLVFLTVTAVESSPFNCTNCGNVKCGENEVFVTGKARQDEFCKPFYTPTAVLKQPRRCVCKTHFVRNSWGGVRSQEKVLALQISPAEGLAPVLFKLPCNRKQSNTLLLPHNVHPWM
ncbi:hypothetical protein MTO96_042120 [Rhipicephalus appendiculatus]